MNEKYAAVGRREFKRSVTGHSEKEHNGLKDRAQRFAMEIAIRYREAGSEDWHEGTTVNISSSGILFRLPRPLKADILDIEFHLPIAIPGEVPAAIECRGKVIRTVSEPEGPDGSTLAVSIGHYKFLRNHETLGRSVKAYRP